MSSAIESMGSPLFKSANAPQGASGGLLGARRMIAIAGVTGLLLFLSDHSLLISQYEGFSEGVESLETGAAAGNAIRSTALLILGLAGLISLFWRGGHRVSIRGPLGMMIVAVVVWCAMSWVWSIEPSIAVRRLLASGCIAVAALAAAKWLTPRELAIASLMCTTTFLAGGVLVELALGTLQPWHGDYRFAGTLHPNHQGLNCALLVIAATCLAQQSSNHCKLLWSLALAGLAGLWLSKSRTPLAALVIAEGIFWFYMTTGPKRLVAAGATLAIGCVALFVAGDSALNSAVEAALLGRGEEESTSALSGRVPLWEELSESIARRPLTGYGFNSFWNPRNIEDISDSQSWAIAVAHSTYLDLALGIGLLGAGMVVGIVLIGLVRALWLHSAYPWASYGFIAVLLLFAIFHGVLESAFANPGFVPLVVQAGLAMVAFVDPAEYLAAEGRREVSTEEQIRR